MSDGVGAAIGALADGEDHRDRKAHARASPASSSCCRQPFAYRGRPACRRPADGARRLSGAQRTIRSPRRRKPATTIELAIEKLDDGEVSPFFHDVAAVGDEIEMRGPLGGHFVWSGSDGGPLLLIGGGSGVVPLMAMVRHRAARASRRCRSRWSFRRASLGRGDLSRRADRPRRPPRRLRPGADADARHAAAGQGFRRRIDAAMIAGVLSSCQALAFVCGANAFVTRLRMR